MQKFEEMMEEMRQMEKVKKMKIGMFKNSSYWGKGSSVLKSGVCKYFRREMFDKFEWCVMEMMVFGVVSEGLLTNIINRIKILVMEEIVDEFEKVSMCVLLFERMEKGNFLEKVEDMKRVCEIVKSCKKGRVVSYVNNWYKYNGEVYKDEVKLDKVLKYKKKGDSEELLVLGERLIGMLEKGDEKVIDIYNKMYGMESVEGSRYRRKEGVYLFMEIVEDYFCKDENRKRVFKFVMDRFNKKEMKERKAFGVWMGLMCLYDREKVVEVKVEEGYDERKMMEYLFEERGDMEISDEFVVEDWHVCKKWGLGKFGKVGSFVLNEKLGILGDNGVKYKEFYILKKEDDEKKVEKEVVEKVENKVEKKKRVKVVEKKVEVEKFDEKYKVVKVLVEGVCGLKKCCVIVEGVENGEKYVLKEMSKSMNEGRDYMCMDKMKKEFGLLDLGMKVVRLDKKIELVDKKNKKWKDNYEWKNDEKGVVYCVMKWFDNKGDLGKNKEVLKEVKYKEENLKIRLFDGLFRSSDNISRNILVLEGGGLLSIDEGDIFGKRKIIFNKSGDVCKKDKWYKENVDRVLDEMLSGENKKERLVEELVKYGFDKKVEEFKERFDKYKEIVKSEFL